MSMSNLGSMREIAVPNPRAEDRAIDLVFRSVGERTADVALELALENVRPNRCFVIDNIRPFSAAVAQMLTIDHDCSHVVHMDADCLIQEDMRPFLNHNEMPYVDCYVHDRFRGRIHCGVHITRLDVVRAMAETTPPAGDLAYVLRPESRRRNLALARLGLEKQLATFRILHDHEQSHRDIFAKYALRELRSRTPYQRERLNRAMEAWGNHLDFAIARAAIAHARAHIPLQSEVEVTEDYIAKLLDLAEVEVPKLNLPVQESFSRRALDHNFAAQENTMKHSGKVFGIGLSRTGTRSLTAALHTLGFDTVHYPIDQQTLSTLVRGDANFPLLAHYDGITDITTIPFIEDLDARFPNSKFVLTVRDEEGWLKSCANHWGGRSAFEDHQDEASEEHRTHMEVRRFLRAAVYGSYEFEKTRFANARRRHIEFAQNYFRNRPEQLLTLNIAEGDGWEKLASFLGCEQPNTPFPHKGKRLSEKLAAQNAVLDTSNLEIDD